MLMRMPAAIMAVHNDDPPYDKKSNGIPVMGIVPMTIPMLTIKWKKYMATMPVAMRVPKEFTVYLIMTTPRPMMREYSPKTTKPPMKPHSSERILKMKSVLCCGRNR